MTRLTVTWISLSCRRETARYFVSLNISLRHSRWLRVIRNDSLQ